MSGMLVTLPLLTACQLYSPLFNSNTIFPADLPTGYTVFPEIGLAYKYYKTPYTWNNARKQCMADGGNLFIADSRQKINVIMAWTGAISKGLHNGIHRCFDNAEWTSVKDGQTPKFVPWKGDPALNDQAKCCSAHFDDGSGVGAWKCLDKLSFVCEIPMVRESRPSGNIDSQSAVRAGLIAN